MAVSQSMQDPYEGLDKTERDSHSVAKVKVMHQRVKGEILLKAAGRRDPQHWGDRPTPGAGVQITINTNLQPPPEQSSGVTAEVGEDKPKP